MIRREDHCDHTGTVLVKAKGGMGNRLLCALTGVCYGMLTGRRVVVDWTDEAYSNGGENAFGRFFRSPLVDPDGALPTLADGETIAPAVWRDHLDWSVSRMMHTYDPTKHKSFRIQRKYSIDPARLDHDESIVVIWAYTHMIPQLRRHAGLLPGERWPNSVDGILRNLLLHHVELVPEIETRLDAFRTAHFERSMIGVHVRHSDRSANVERYVTATRRMLDAMPDSGIFLATDNRAVLERFRDTFDDVVATDKWYPDAGATMHQNDSCPDRYENGVEALLDMYLLGDCDALLYPRGSTFSYIGALRSAAPSNRIVDMERFNLRVRTARVARRLLA